MTAKVSKKKGSIITKGQKFRVINSSGCNGLKTGDIVVATHDTNNTEFECLCDGGYRNIVILGRNVEKLAWTIEMLKEKKGEIQKDIEDIDVRIEFMEFKKLEELDEDRFLNYMLLKEINKDSPAEEKEEVINDLLKRYYDGSQFG